MSVHKAHMPCLRTGRGVYGCRVTGPAEPRPPCRKRPARGLCEPALPGPAQGPCVVRGSRHLPPPPACPRTTVRAKEGALGPQTPGPCPGAPISHRQELRVGSGLWAMSTRGPLSWFTVSYCLGVRDTQNQHQKRKDRGPGCAGAQGPRLWGYLALLGKSDSGSMVSVGR